MSEKQCSGKTMENDKEKTLFIISDEIQFKMSENQAGGKTMERSERK